MAKMNKAEYRMGDAQWQKKHERMKIQSDLILVAKMS